ncbi:hypothetical protein Tco_1145388 [Tanacetum coccineum]
MTSGREITPPPGFLAMPTTTTMFAATTPENTPLAYRASILTNPNPVISPTFMEANYETLESLLRDRRRQMRNNDLRTELEYFSEDYYEERVIEPRPEPARARGKQGRKEQRRWKAFGRSIKRKWKSECKPSSTFRSPHMEKQEWETFVVFPDFRLRSYPFYTQPMYTFPNMPAYANPNSIGLFPNPLGSVTPFVRWIEDYPLPNGLKMPSHIGSYDGKGDLDNFLHLFEGAIRMQKWLIPVACHMFTYTLKDSARIWWNSQKAGSILDYEDLKAKF